MNIDVRNRQLQVRYLTKKWISWIASLLCVLLLSIIPLRHGVIDRYQNHIDQISGTEKEMNHLEGYIATHVHTNCNLIDVDLSGKSYSQSREDFALFRKYFSSPLICGGIYVEIGALDGIQFSNTKVFEDYLGWNGLLIEAEPRNAAKLKRNRPKNMIVPQGVCPGGQKTMNFIGRDATGGMPDQMSENHIKRFIKSHVTRNITCKPLSLMLTESGIVAVDVFILDVEGGELKVLETMDWTIPVKIFVVEMGRQEKDKKVISLLAKHGYKEAQWNIRDFCLPRRDCADNMVFEHPNYTYSVK